MIYALKTNRLPMMIPGTIFIFVLALACCQAAQHPQSDAISPGSGSFVFQHGPQGRQRPITVWYDCPATLHRNTRILFVMHGVKRNGEKYRDDWRKTLRGHNVLLMVPEFSQEHFPGSASYNRGNVISRTGEPVDKDEWSYAAIEGIFDHAKSLTGLTTRTYGIYGHSAGAQFVHRLVMYMPDAKFDQAVAANAGWYMMPDSAVGFPYGLAGSGVSDETLKKALARRLTILLGTKDTDPNHKDLRKTPEAMAQGKHRLERGMTFYEVAKRRAKELNVRLAWNLKTAPGVAHSNSKMSLAAKKILLK